MCGVLGKLELAVCHGLPQIGSRFASQSHHNPPSLVPCLPTSTHYVTEWFPFGFIPASTVATPRSGVVILFVLMLRPAHSAPRLSVAWLSLDQLRRSTHRSLPELL